LSIFFQLIHDSYSWWDPYETSQRRDFTYRPNSSAECPTSTSFIDSFSQSRPFGSSVYHEDFNWKPACKPECIRTGTASGQRRNNPHPSKVGIYNVSSEYVSFPWKCSPSEGEICKALTAQYRSTYRCDFMGMPQGRREKRLVPPCSRRRVPTSTDTEMRDSYRQPKQRPEVNHCHYSCNMNRRTACRGIVPSVVQRHVLTQQKDSDLTTYDRFLPTVIEFNESFLCLNHKNPNIHQRPELFTYIKCLIPVEPLILQIHGNNWCDMQFLIFSWSSDMTHLDVQRLHSECGNICSIDSPVKLMEIDQ
uniref:Uncharacterized protein n=1 Tax=Sphaeramia orbicularis TaxID=375764 RepID=A0A672ZGC1_9TELE